MHTRLIPFVRAAATVAVVAGTMFASAASAQVCPYNSTQGTCACPTSGAGTTCFGGQLFRASDNSCQNDARPCAANQNWNCSTTSCVCNTASFPCGGCTGPTSNPGDLCGAPTGGVYTNVCGACACPAGKTLCSSSNTCVANRSCPQGTTWDPCTDTCGTPNVLLSPGWIQSGFIQVNGDVKSTAGNIRLDSATAAGQGDIYVANGKAIRIDGAGVTNINIGNWGVGGTGVDVNFPASSRLCFGATCRNSWPSTADFNPTYVNASGAETMSGPLTVNNDVTLAGASTDLFVAGKIGVGTTTPANRLDVEGGVAVGSAFSGSTVAPTDGMLVQGAVSIGPTGLMYSNQLLNVVAAGPVTSPLVTIRDNSAGVEMNFSRNTILQRGSNLVLDTGEGDIDLQTFGVSKLYIERPSNGGHVGIGTTTPVAPLDVNGTVRMTGFLLPTGAGVGRYLMSDASGNGTWQAASFVGGSGSVDRVPKFTATSTLGDSNIYTSATDVSINTPATEGYALNVQTKATNFGDGIQIHHASQGQKWQLAVLGTGTTNPGALSIQNNPTGGNHLLISQAGNVGINTTTPATSLDVAGEVNVASAASSGAGLTVNKSGAGNAYGIYVTTGASGNAMSAIRAVNSGTGPGIEVNGGSNAMAALIRAGGNNPALDAAVYDHTSPNTLETVMQLRRATTGTPAVGMGGAMRYVLEGAGGSHYGASQIGSVIASLSPWKTDMVFHASTYDVGENMRLTSGGSLGIGTASPTARLHMNGGSTALGLSSTATGSYSLASGYGPTASGSYAVALGDRSTATNTAAIAIGAQADATGYYGVALGNYVAATGSGSIAIGGGIDVSRKMTVSGGSTIGLGYGSTVPTLTVTSAPNTAGTYGKVGVAATAPAAKLSVGGNGVDVYATDIWVENNMHVQGNETMTQGGGRGRLRVGSAWGYPGLYAEPASNGSANDLVLGASSSHVLINANSFGQPGGSATLELWGSRLSDTGSGVLNIQSGGSVVSFNGSDNVGIGTSSPAQKFQVYGGGAYGYGALCGTYYCLYPHANGWIYTGDTAGNVYGGVGLAAENIWANSTVYIGGVGRSSWPTLDVTTVRTDCSYCNGWHYVYCPSGYQVTGWAGYNCNSSGGDWNCGKTWSYDTYVGFLVNNTGGTAYTQVRCARVQ